MWRIHRIQETMELISNDDMWHVAPLKFSSCTHFRLFQCYSQTPVGWREFCKENWLQLQRKFSVCVCACAYTYMCHVAFLLGRFFFSKGRRPCHLCSLHVFQQANKEQVSPCSRTLQSWRLLCLLNHMTMRPERHEPMWSGFVWNHSGISCQSAPSSLPISLCILSVPRLLISPLSFPFPALLALFFFLS